MQVPTAEVFFMTPLNPSSVASCVQPDDDCLATKLRALTVGLDLHDLNECIVLLWSLTLLMFTNRCNQRLFKGNHRHFSIIQWTRSRLHRNWEISLNINPRSRNATTDFLATIKRLLV